MRPPAMGADGAASHGAAERKLTLLQFIAQVLALLAAPVPVAMRAWLMANLSVKQASDLGRRRKPRATLNEWRATVELVLKAILAGKLKGYGPVRLRFAAELALDLAEQLDALAKRKRTRSGRSAEVRQEIARVDLLRGTALTVITNLGGRREDTTARRVEANDTSNSNEGSIESLDNLVQEIERLVEQVPPELARDAGATDEFIRALREACDGASGATRAHAESATDVASGYDALRVLRGRLQHELQALQAAARNARKSDPTVPSIGRATVTRGPKRAKKPAPPTPPTPPV